MFTVQLTYPTTRRVGLTLKPVDEAAIIQAATNSFEQSNTLFKESISGSLYEVTDMAKDAKKIAESSVSLVNSTQLTEEQNNQLQQVLILQASEAGKALSTDLNTVKGSLVAMSGTIGTLTTDLGKLDEVCDSNFKSIKATTDAFNETFGTLQSANPSLFTTV
jgi:hypothetical protein